MSTTKKVKKPLEITDSLLLKMLKSSVYRQNFQFIDDLAEELEQASKKVKKSSCGCAAKKIAQVTPSQLSEMRRKIYRLPMAKKLKLKQLLQTSEIVIQTVDEENKPVRLKF